MFHSAPKVYLIHGWAANRHIFDDLILHLPTDWDIHAVNLPGHGDESFDGKFDIAAIADTFASQINTPTHILGWSLGGLVALYMAARHPDKVCSLCLSASFAKFLATTDYPEGLSHPALAKMIGFFQQDYAKHIQQFLQLQLLNTDNAAEILNRLMPDLVRHGTPQALQAALDAVNQADARSFLADLSIPTLLVYGQKDSITPMRMGEYLHQHLPNSQLHLFAKAAHAPFLSHADEFAILYRQFIEAV